MPHADLEEHRASVRRYHRDPANRETVERAKKTWVARNPEKRSAAIKVGNAVRDGRLVKEACLFCDDPKVQAHHHDYSRPFDVTWLCQRHHQIAHGRCRG